jgi:hypothetical protein
VHEDRGIRFDNEQAGGEREMCRQPA